MTQEGIEEMMLTIDLYQGYVSDIFDTLLLAQIELQDGDDAKVANE
jgi:hypothetical protein